MSKPGNPAAGRLLPDPVAPILLLPMPAFRWRDLVPGGAVCRKLGSDVQQIQGTAANLPGANLSKWPVKVAEIAVGMGGPIYDFMNPICRFS